MQLLTSMMTASAHVKSHYQNEQKTEIDMSHYDRKFRINVRIDWGEWNQLNEQIQTYAQNLFS